MIINENHNYFQLFTIEDQKKVQERNLIGKIIQGFHVFSLAKIKKLNCAKGSRVGDNCKMGFHEIFMILLLKIPGRTRFANRGLEISFQIGT